MSFEEEHGIGRDKFAHLKRDAITKSKIRHKLKEIDRKWASRMIKDKVTAKSKALQNKKQ